MTIFDLLSRFSDSNSNFHYYMRPKTIKNKKKKKKKKTETKPASKNDASASLVHNTFREQALEDSDF
jgi:hypothetical protein